MLQLGSDELAKYPFVADAGQYLRDQGFTLEQFGADPDLQGVVKRAYERIRTAADGGIYRSDLEAGGISREAALPMEVFSFLLAVVLLKLCGKYTLVRRFSLAEARRAERHLERDLGGASDGHGEQLATRIIGDLFSVKVGRMDEHFVIPVPDYLRHSVKFNEREWKLVNRRVEGGKVFLTPHETVRLIRAELDVYIRSRIDGARTPSMIPGFEEYAQKLVMLSKRFEEDVVVTGEHPPCIKHAIGVLERGENLPHSGRFMLATFLLARGWAVEKIAPLFKNAPDYKESVTMYQLNHLAGDSGRSTRYSCPSCKKLTTQGLCYKTSECGTIFTPLHFGRRKRQ